MSLLDIFTSIKSDFDGLWQTKQRGKTLEIITPYSSTNNKFISVFLTRQRDEYVISDGGWLDNGVYETTVNDEMCFLKILNHYQDSFNIKQVTNADIIYYYIKTKNEIDISSKLLDLALFIQSIVSVSAINFEDKVEKENKERFNSVVNKYLKSFINDKLQINQYLTPDKRDIKFNAIYNNTSSNMSLINYVTGSTNNNFANSISKANMLFQMAEDSHAKPFISNKLAIVDNNADGFNQNKIGGYLYHLEHHTGSTIINWSERERLKIILN